MPHLKLFKRTWKYSEDEFVVSSACQAVIRIFLSIVAGVYLLISPFWSPFSRTTPQAIFITTVSFCLVQIILYIAIAIVSSQGGAFETEKRKSLWIWILLHIFITMLELIFYCLSIWQVHNLYRGDTKKATYHEFISVICWCSILMITIVFEIVDWIRHYDVHGKLKYEFYYTFLYDHNGYHNKTDDEKREIIRQLREVSHTKWKKFLINIMPPLAAEIEDNGLDDAIHAVAGAIVDFFTDLDVTPSDLALGLTLLRWQSLKWIGGVSRVPANYVLTQTDPVITDIAAPLNLDVRNPTEKLEKNWLHISYLKRYCDLANASYGWVWYVGENPCDCVAISRLFGHLSCRNPKAPDRQVDLENGITGPGGCLCAGRNCYLSAFLEMSKLETSHILVFDVTDKVYNAAAMMVIDDITEAIVIIVRGTLTGTDALIDLVAAGEPLRDEDYNLPEHERLVAHHGMGRTAKNITKKIIEDKWVESARELRPNYPLVITGHSLGAGIVSLMCILLKPHFPEVKSYAFSPPGGLMNKNLANLTHDCLCSVTYGYDIVGHLESQTMEDLRARIFHALCVYKIPKFYALSNQLCLTITRNLVCKSRLPRVIKLDAETKSKLLDPDMNDAYETPIGSKFKPYLNDRVIRTTKIDRLYPTDRSLMRWKNPNCHSLLVLPRPYPKSLYPESLLEPKKQNLYTLDFMMESMLRPIPSYRLLHIIEVDKEFEIEGVQPYKKRGYEPPPIGLWTNAETFNSILVHPKMLFNHSPVYVCTAVNRLYNSIMHPEKVYKKVRISTHHREAEPVPGIERKFTGEDLDRFCRIRRLK